MAQHNKTCANCGKLGHSKFYCPTRKPKPIPKRGKETKRYEKFRDEIARPHLDSIGRRCAVHGCYETDSLDVDHIKERGSRHDLKYELSNLRYLCRIHHREVTDGKRDSYTLLLK